MKARRLVMILFFTCTLLNACYTSLQPITTPETIIDDDRIVATWESRNGTFRVEKFFSSGYYRQLKQNGARFTLNDSTYLKKHYIISREENDFEYVWAAGIVRINNEEYTNLFPADCLDKNNLSIYPTNGHESLQTYSIAKLQWTGNNKIGIQMMNGDLIKQLTLSEKIRIKYESDPLFGMFLITASSEELQKFIAKYGKDKKLYSAREFLLTRNQRSYGSK